MIGYLWSKLIKKIRWKSIASSEIDRTSKIEAGSQVVNTVMDKYSFCGYDCKIINCKIGKYVSIADGVVIGGARHPMEWVSMSPVFYHGRDSIKKKFAEFPREDDKRTVIGNDVWIGERALIKAGVTIGDGAVIGMGSVVTKDIGSYEIWAGNPAKKIRDRFSENLKEDLSESKWWDLPDNEIQKLAVSIRSPEEFINTMRAIKD
ncbi:CatB-related O-acetyltransferase [Butyrivibrio sp. INlla14]|uniref:CatB-related O-acetyltransferase n=1 Tax=Butyrivibrio sp. INlla14 TaxID=1520808 RepID=UPI00087728FC|nr:CatB-related O-acetyltransferase [Butyrivibrio sp. INlla14]SCY72678.1 transferase hexapeptide (six repeat-containing protein) [Butyrivibrio sp. INlla14]